MSKFLVFTSAFVVTSIVVLRYVNKALIDVYMVNKNNYN